MAFNDEIHVRCDMQDKRRWEKAAAKDGRTLASWIRARLNEAARRELSDESTGESTDD